MTMTNRELLFVLLSQILCSSAAAIDNNAPAPIRKRTQQSQHSSSHSSNLRGGTIRRETDNFDPFIGVPRDLSSRSMSLSMPTTSTPTPNPTIALVFMDEIDEIVPAMTFDPETSSPTTSPAATLMPTFVMDEGFYFFVGSGIYIGGGEGTEEEPITTLPPIRYDGTTVPVTSSPTMSPVTPKPTLLPTSVYTPPI
ncbi:hypothetical protein ACHAWT_005831 [Skeletonema menzelii]